MKDQNSGLSEIVKTICSWVEGFIFLFGCYIVLFGHLTPGGGFAGGVILAGTFILIMLSYGKGRIERLLTMDRASLFEAIGALIFLAVGWLGIYIGSGFFTNYIHEKFDSLEFTFLSAGTIPISNIGIALKVLAGLYLIFFMLSVTRTNPEKDSLKEELE